MYITIDHSRLPEIIPAVRPGDRVETELDKYKVRVYLDILEVTADGIRGKLSEDGNQLFKRLHSWAYSNEVKHQVYFVAWDKVDSLYMKG
jgi:hypothetical protein